MYSGSIIFVWEINITVKTKYTMIIVFRSTYLSAGNWEKCISHASGLSKKFIGKLFGNEETNKCYKHFCSHSL